MIFLKKKQFNIINNKTWHKLMFISFNKINILLKTLFTGIPIFFIKNYYLFDHIPCSL